MDDNDRQAIGGLFARLDEVGRQAPPRDPEAEAFIARAMARLPGAAYHMAQTVVAQEAALAAAHVRIEAMRARLERRSGGGIFGSLFGDDAGPPAGRTQTARAPTVGGGFLAGAAQTALGVTGGLLLADALGGMFGGAEAAPASPEDEAGTDDAGLDEAGGDLDMDF